MARRGRLKAVLVNATLVVASLLVSFVVAEAALRAFSPIELRVRGDHIDLPRFKRYEMDNPEGRKLDARIVHVRNALGFRGPNPPRDFADRLTVLTVGGSTTECFYLSEGTTWPDLLAAGLTPHLADLWLNNAGLGGHSTFGHLMLMEQYVVPLRPKVVLFLVGVNDRAKEEASRFDRSIDPEAGGFLETARLALLRHSEALSLLWSAHKRWKATRLGIDRDEIDFARLPAVEVAPAEMEKELARHRPFLAAYEARLRRLISLARDNGILPVLATQPAVYGPAVDPTTGVDLGRMAADPGNGALAWAVLELYNDVTRRVGAETGMAVIDLGHRLPKDSADFYDYIHLSRAGAARVARILAIEMCPLLQRAFSDKAAAPCPPAVP